MRSTAAPTGSGRRTATATVTHGWKPEKGFLRYRWQGYNEASAPLCARPRLADISAARRELCGLDRPPTSGRNSTATSFSMAARCSCTSSRISGSIFAASRMLSCAAKASTISRTAGGPPMCSSDTRFAIRSGFVATARMPGASPPATVQVRQSVEYEGRGAPLLRLSARGVPYGPDDGTLAPWAVDRLTAVCAGNRSAGAATHCYETYLQDGQTSTVWRAASTRHCRRRRPSTRLDLACDHFALDQGPVILMIENYRSDLIWRLMRRVQAIVRGLRRAGLRAAGSEKRDEKQSGRRHRRHMVCLGNCSD